MAFKTNKPLTPDEKRELLALLSEATSRGIKIPSIGNKADVLKEWPIDDNGYFVAGDGSHYVPSDNHKAFLGSGARYKGLIGGRGSGKTTTGIQACLFKIKEGKSGAVIHPTFEDFKNSTWPEFRKWIPWNQVVPNQRHRKFPEWQPTQPFTLVFLNGARVLCKGLKDPNSARGPNLNWLMYDEGAIDPTGEAWQIANAGIRIGSDAQAWTVTTPKGQSHWLYKFFHSQESITPEMRAAFKAASGNRALVEEFHCTIEDNKQNLDPAFYAALLAAYPPGYLREQELNGVYANEGGKIGFSSWFQGKIVDEIPEHWQVLRRCRYWDMAGTEKKTGAKKNDPDEAVGSLVGRANHEEAEYVVYDQVAGTWGWDKLKVTIADTAKMDGPYITVVIEQEPGSGGKNQVAELQSYFKTIPELVNHTVVAQRPTDRVIEANVWFASASRGKVWLQTNNAWNQPLLDQVDGFTLIKHDDRVTSLSGAVRWLTPFKTWKKVEFVKL